MDTSDMKVFEIIMVAFSDAIEHEMDYYNPRESISVDYDEKRKHQGYIRALRSIYLHERLRYENFKRTGGYGPLL